MHRVRVRAVVSGRVQGVFYRASTADEARSRNLSGWVRNREDGSVELEAEGTDEAVQDLIAWCRVGPPAARVETVTVESCACVGEGSFEVRR
jgi:acylphosphatase